MAILAFGLSFSACGNASQETEQNSKKYTSAYVCPMHCEGSGSDQAGKCPVCAMDYVANAEHESDGHDHDQGEHNQSDHEGHTH